MKNTEIAVVGGGLVGQTTALLLAQAGITVVVIDPVTPLPVRDDPYDLRTYALTPASRRILTHIGVWNALDQARVTAFSGMQVWDAARGGELAFAADLVPPATALGYIVEQSNLLAAAQRAMQAQTRIAGLGGQVTGVTEGDDDCVVHLGDGREIRARVVLACDGADSPVRELAGIACADHDYGQHAVVANVTTTLPHAGIARQRFIAEGPLAFLPLPPTDMCAVVWTTTSENAAWATRCHDEEFCAALTSAFDQRLGTVTASSRRVAFPLRRRHATTYCRGRVALVGDAAHVIHPLAGQGLNLGLLDAACVAEVLTDSPRGALQHPQSLLRRYARTRRGDNLAMLTLTDKLNRLFTAREPWLTWLRNTGMVGLNRAHALKRLLAAHAMGEGGDLPRLATTENLSKFEV
jgi:2-polyprenylphenol 6-hydroxylase